MLLLIDALMSTTHKAAQAGVFSEKTGFLVEEVKKIQKRVEYQKYIMYTYLTG
jgi:hypothetical protein